VKDNDAIKALIVEIDSPGGTSVGGEQLYVDLRDIAKKKPVVAVMRTMATSAAYMAALGTDHIVAREGTITGSVGVIVQTAEVTRLADKLGIDPITVKSGSLKATPSPIEKFNPADEAMLQDVVNDFFNYFVDLVVTRRKLTDEQLEQIQNGRVFTGRQALKVNLVDQLGGEPEALRWLGKNKKIDTELEIKTVKVKKPENLLTDLSETISSGTILENLLGNQHGLVSIWRPGSAIQSQQ
jgi:protease IV